MARGGLENNFNQKKIGEILVREGIITAKQLSLALEEQRESKEPLPLGKSLLKLGFISEDELAKALAKQKSYPFIELSNYPIDQEAARLITSRLAKQYSLIPIGFSENKLLVAMANPLDVVALDSVRYLTKFEIIPVVSTFSEIEKAIEKTILDDKSISVIPKESEVPSEKEIKRALEKSSPIISLVDKIIYDGFISRASDIHIEPMEDRVRVRYRIDGVLLEKMTIEKKDQHALVSRIKILSDLDISEHRVPQDGSFQLSIKKEKLDIRVSVMPSINGEAVTLRLLRKENKVLELTETGMPTNMIKQVLDIASRQSGAILVTGPTGSGKTTTLYSLLTNIATPDKKTITIEDPVEYVIPGLTQINIHNKAGLTFARGLRSIVRADPDIIMVGEIRDRETAEIAIQAALTGHMVLSTFHANDAATAPSRLIEMGIEPYLITSALNGVISQRLIRLLCENCKESYCADEEALKLLGLKRELKECELLYRPKGCQKCSMTGYFGRTAIFEFLLLTSKISRALVLKKGAEEINKIAQDEGMVTLKKHGLEKVKAGLTSLAEVLRVSKY